MKIKKKIKNYFNNNKEKKKQKEQVHNASQLQLIWWKFKKHRLARIGMVVLALLYFLAIFAEFIVPHNPQQRYDGNKYAPPTSVHFQDEDGQWRRPFIYGRDRELDSETFQYEFVEDKSEKHNIYLFVEREPYKLFGFIPLNFTLFGTKTNAPPLFLFGADGLSRDLFSRIIYGGRISLFIGFAGVFVSFVIGCILGGISGYVGGLVDEMIQRIIDVVLSIPHIPLWMALSAAVPQNWGVVKTYFAITLILGAIGWTSLARTVRGKFLSLREEEFVLAAKVAGCTNTRIIIKHLFPSFVSYLIVNITLAIPHMIIGETALSFLGLGLQPPAVSWGVLLQDAQNLKNLSHHPWLLLPCLFVIITVLMFNFVGDGLRDAADPYSQE